ncbi:DNA repair protein RecN [Radicibacter daui]|uniref:DNA repair protein RecN n=1 Tax=Radicibacter daui TaxID=3064829 RepID=UPI004046DBD0
MLAALSIRDVVLIDRLDLSFAPGLSVLTGETGAGKSILLDSLGLALGARADSALVRHGTEQAAVTATFDVPDDHPAFALIAEQGLEAESPLIIRRSLTAEGRSRAWINDQPVSVTLLRQVGTLLVEIHGQFDTHGLLDPTTHRSLLDAHAGLGMQAEAVDGAWKTWRQAEKAHADAAEESGRARQEEEFLRHAVSELELLACQPGEADQLAERRTRLAHAEKLVEALTGADSALAGDRGAEAAIANASRALTRQAEKAGGAFDGAIEALDRAATEIQEALALLHSASADIDMDPRALEQVEERLFALRSAARKHNVEIDRLPALRDDLARRLALIEDQGESLGKLAQAAEMARATYLKLAQALGAARRAAALELDNAVAAELEPLRLGRARFVTVIDTAPEAGWGPHGTDTVAFLVATNPGTPPAPLARVASGGELARFMLALKVVLARVSAAATLVFDEVDTGIGGATADAVGERLARLGDNVQVLVVTHSPQVAARGRQHLKVEKQEEGARLATRVRPLEPGEREDEIARMLSGASITDPARAAAAALLAQRG